MQVKNIPIKQEAHNRSGSRPLQNYEANVVKIV